ncbi:TIR domain-containing protein [Arthrobacter sp. zg-Y877]|uniref:TIR domain-containing protein n=1 Tax=Arthrobacter sp. zg-Y877 TaxID=3049074 RepID=UPI0025A43BC3|nr:TIR domain-containing protein [Arthrobacter sp. zg-Y877]MDM7989793.1 TIR domain-containing protein [Arthrobacter sp. zg-Y877]
MQIFISWSGSESHTMALLLREWLVRVLQYSAPFVSSQDISKGAQWLITISDELNDTSEGIVCVTGRNYESPWLNYEAGALAKTTGQTAVRTVLLGLAARDIPPSMPLSNFQHTIALDKSEMWALVRSIHSRSGAGDADISAIEWAFNQSWPELKNNLEAIEVPPQAVTESGDEQSLIKDVLQEVKSLSISLAALGESVRKADEPPEDSKERLSDEEIRVVRPGTALRHRTFGIGLVIAVEKEGKEKVATINFRDGQKRLLLRYAPVTIVP